MSQEIRKARLREIGQEYQQKQKEQEKTVPIAHKRVKEGLGAVRD